MVRFNPATNTATGSVNMTGGGGTSAGELGGMDIDSSGSLWVTDLVNHDIYIVNPASLTWSTMVGGNTSGAGSFGRVTDIALTNGTAASIAASR